MTSTVAIVTGTRAEFGLLEPVIESVDADPALEARVVVAGAHLLPPAMTRDEVAARFEIASEVPMQRAGRTGRLEDARALARGVDGMARMIERLSPDWVLVLGDRIEALAASVAASVSGVALAHVHAGDRAEGIADESMRHAITKLANLHLAATESSAARVVRMGERPEHVVTTGSPAVDHALMVEPLDAERYDALGRPTRLVLLHPAGMGPEHDRSQALALVEALEGEHTLWLHPNFDAGRETILETLAEYEHRPRLRTRSHLPHEEYRSLVRRLAAEDGLVLGNSSSGLIDAAILGSPAVDVGPRQAGRERPGSVVHTEGLSADEVGRAIGRALGLDRGSFRHPYGEDPAGPRIASALASRDPHDPTLLRKRCAF
jgi:UDP-hydrolysing UDP-N-acetyl-D-glucosamine 2-epimerase